MIVCSKPKFRALDGKNLKVRAHEGHFDSVAESKLLGIKIDNCLTWDILMAYVKEKNREATWPTEKNKEISFTKSKNFVL